MVTVILIITCATLITVRSMRMPWNHHVCHDLFHYDELHHA